MVGVGGVGEQWWLVEGEGYGRLEVFGVGGCWGVLEVLVGGVRGCLRCWWEAPPMDSVIEGVLGVRDG